MNAHFCWYTLRMVCARTLRAHWVVSLVVRPYVCVSGDQRWRRRSDRCKNDHRSTCTPRRFTLYHGHHLFEWTDRKNRLMDETIKKPREKTKWTDGWNKATACEYWICLHLYIQYTYHLVKLMPIQCKSLRTLYSWCLFFSHSVPPLASSPCVFASPYSWAMQARASCYSKYTLHSFLFPPLDLALHTSLFHSTIHFVFWSRVILLLLHWPFVCTAN